MLKETGDSSSHFANIAMDHKYKFVNIEIFAVVVIRKNSGWSWPEMILLDPVTLQIHSVLGGHIMTSAI